MARFLQHIDKILLAVCVVAFLAVAAFAPVGFRKLDGIASTNPAAGIELARYEPPAMQVPTISTAAWPDPEPQAQTRGRGREWVFDVFTPPVIYYNRQTSEFTVTPPVVNAPVVARTDETFDVSLLRVRQEPYRIQLVGYAGSQDSYLATFELADTGETVIGRAGSSFDERRGSFTVRSFDLRKLTTAVRDSMPVVETVAVAVIRDERTGREETLTTLERKMMPRLQAVLRLNTNPPEDRAVREGSSVEVNGRSYLVIQLSLNPPQAVVSRRAPDSLGASETRTLQPVPDPTGSQSLADARTPSFAASLRP